MLDDVEIPDDHKAPDAHLTINTIADPDGTEHRIMRFNMPFGRVGEVDYGTYFAGYCRTPDVLERMLTNMFVGRPPGTTDRVLDFSTAVTGGLFFVPPLRLLDELPAPAGD